MSDGGALFCEALTKAALYLALQCAVGAAAAYWLARSCGVIASSGQSEIEGRLQRAALWASAALLASTVARSFGHAAAAFGLIDADSLRTVALESRWGHSWRIQAGAAVLLCVTGQGVWRARRTGWTLYSFAALLYCACVPLVGHGAGAWPRTALHAVHVAAGAVWIGTLVMLVFLVSGRRPGDAAAVRRMIEAFSGVALPSAAILVATGTVASVLYVQQIAHLWDSTYGRVLVAKLSLVAVVAACGRRNWQRSRRGATPSLRVMMIELSAAALVVMVTGVLTELEHP